MKIDNIQGIFFDFDGVIGRTFEDNLSAWIYALKKNKVAFDQETYALLEGKRSIEIIKAMLPKAEDRTIHKILEQKNNYYEKHNKFSTYSGIIELITMLRNYNYNIGLVSGGSRKRIFSCLSPEIIRLFDCIITGDDTKETKPSPVPYLQAAENIKLDPENCLVVENAPLGIISAKVAGMTCVAISTTLAKKHLLLADYIVKDHIELTNTLTNALCYQSTTTTNRLRA